MNITYGQAILAINSNAEYQIRENNLDTIEWYADTTPISKADILAKQSELQAKEDNLPNVKASAKAKLIAGETMTEEEANVLLGV
jgi:hypothetical protein|tara:strand:+ start:579 stop:833 length:255 start_codon:yes stop_codon:yes gene_type:complete